MKDEKFVCCICGNICLGFGNNPVGAMWKTIDGKVEEPEFKSEDRCCNDCDNRYVIPGRIYKLYHNKEAK